MSIHATGTQFGILIGMLGGALLAAEYGWRMAFILFGIFQLSPVNVVTGIDGFLLTVLTRTACGAIIPIVTKVFMWYEGK